MRIIFKTSKLLKVFNDNQLLIKQYGPIQAHEINKKMAILLAAPKLKNVPATKPTRRHKLTGNLEGNWSIDLRHPYRLIIQPIGELEDLLETEEIMIIGVMNTHD